MKNRPSLRSIQPRAVLFGILTALIAFAGARASAAMDDSQVSACAEHLRQVTCWSTKIQADPDPECAFDKVPASALASLQEQIPLIPPFHRRVLCKVNRVQLHASLPTIAKTSFLLNSAYQVVGDVIMIRADALNENSTDIDLLSRKERLNFGLSSATDRAFAISDRGPTVQDYVGGVRLKNFLPILVHEIGHLIDSLNKANATQCLGPLKCAELHQVIAPVAGSFTALSWPSSWRVVSASTSDVPPEWASAYPFLSQMCYYNCRPGTANLSPEQAPDVYAELRGSSFMTSYSSVNYSEDFAEAAKIWALKTSGQDYHYRIKDADGRTLFDLDEQWGSPQLQAKKQWLERFFKRADLKDHIEAP